MSTPVNPAQPYYPQIDKSIDPKVIRHLQNLYTAINQHDLAIIKVNTKVTNLPTTTSTNTTEIVSSSSSSGSSVTDFTGLGSVNNQSGHTTYQLQQSDSGALVVFNDASAIALSLNNVITSPFFCFVTNLGVGTITCTPTSGTVNGAGTFALSENNLSIIVFSGGNWWASAFPVVPVNTPAVAHEWLASYNNGTFTQTQPAFSDISGSVAPSQLPTPTVSTLGGVEAIVAVTSNWINAISTAGVPQLSQPTSADVLPASGATGSRPTVHAVGQPFFDTTLGIPIWWNGTAWVNASGTPV